LVSYLKIGKIIFFPVIQLSSWFQWQAMPDPLKTMPPRRRVEFLSARTRSVSRIVQRLQRWWRTWRRMLPTNNTEESGTLWRVRAGGRDVRCPISQDSIELVQCFRFVTASGHVIAFATDALAAYLRSSGRFKCPCTQEKFNAIVVSRIERRAVAAGAPAHGLRGAYEMRSAIVYREIEHANRLLAYENSCGADLNEALDICSDFDLTRERANRYLLRDVLPNWRQTCSDYMRLNREACRVMLQSDTERLRRLSSIDDADVHGLLHIVIDAVDERLRACGEARTVRALERREEVLRDWLREDFSAASEANALLGGWPFFTPASSLGVNGVGSGARRTGAFGSSLFALGSLNDVLNTPAAPRIAVFGGEASSLLFSPGALNEVLNAPPPPVPRVSPPVAPDGAAAALLTGQGLTGLTLASSRLDQFAGLLGLHSAVQGAMRSRSGDVSSSSAGRSGLN
jgi:hypothetical protein